MIGGVGLIKKLSKPLGHILKQTNSSIILIGKTFGHLGQSCYLKENFSITDCKPFKVNFLNEKYNGITVMSLISQNLILSAHDVSSGGLLVALCEMSMGSNLGINIEKPKKLTNLNEYFFGEDQGRYILEIDQKNLSIVEKILKNNEIYYENIGFTQKKFLEIKNEMKIDTNELFKRNNQWYNNY